MQTEVAFLARVSHPNIVKLLGYCQENEECLIVYEFMQKGSLNYHLFGSKDQESSRLLLRHFPLHAFVIFADKLTSFWSWYAVPFN